MTPYYGPVGKSSHFSETCQRNMWVFARYGGGLNVQCQCRHNVAPVHLPGVFKGARIQMTIACCILVSEHDFLFIFSHWLSLRSWVCRRQPAVCCWGWATQCCQGKQISVGAAAAGPEAVLGENDLSPLLCLSSMPSQKGFMLSSNWEGGLITCIQWVLSVPWVPPFFSLLPLSGSCSWVSSVIQSVAKQRFTAHWSAYTEFRLVFNLILVEHSTKGGFTSLVPKTWQNLSLSSLHKTDLDLLAWFFSMNMMRIYFLYCTVQKKKTCINTIGTKMQNAKLSWIEVSIDHLLPVILFCRWMNDMNYCGERLRTSVLNRLPFDVLHF